MLSRALSPMPRTPAIPEKSYSDLDESRREMPDGTPAERKPQHPFVPASEGAKREGVSHPQLILTPSSPRPHLTLTSSCHRCACESCRGHQRRLRLI